MALSGMLEDGKNGRKESGIKMSELKLCPFCGKEQSENNFFSCDGYPQACGCWEKSHTGQEAIDIWNTRPIEDALNDSITEWKADAERLASLVEDERNAYDAFGRDGVKGITDKGYKKLEYALNAHKVLVEKNKPKKSWGELTKQVLDENRGAWEDLGRKDK